MAHKILGIDLGSYSVKIAELEAGFRQARLCGLYELRLLPKEPREPEGVEESELERAARTAAQLIAEERLDPEMCTAALKDEATLRLVKLPFADAKKIDQVLGYELESQILGDLEGLVIDKVISTADQDGTQVLAVAAPEAHVRALITALGSFGAEPRVVGAAVLSYAALASHFADGEVQAVIDVGHRQTQICIVQGQVVLFARSILRGAEEVTTAIDGLIVSSSLKSEFADATEAKHHLAFIAPPGAAPESPTHRRIDECVRNAVRPLLRELRQTLAAYRANGAIPTRLLVTGGGARLRGFSEHLEAELEIPVAQLQLSAADPFIAPTLSSFDDALGEALPAQALGMALAAAAPVPQVNLRKGELAYRSDFSFLRGKASYLAAALASILVFAGLNAFMSLRVQRKESEALAAQLRRQTTELFGEPRLDGKSVSEELRRGPKGGSLPIPTLSAFDVLDEISRHVPAASEGKLDVLELDIKPKKVYLKATAESLQQVENLAKALRLVDCFTEVQTGKASSVTVPPSGDNSKGEKPNEMKEFTLNIGLNCR